MNEIKIQENKVKIIDIKIPLMFMVVLMVKIIIALMIPGLIMLIILISL